MADNASVMFRTQYVDRVQAIYQQKGGKLRGMTSTPTSFNGSAEAKFFVAGKNTAYETISAGQQNAPSGQPITPVTVALRTFTVYDHVYEWDEDRLSVDEKEVIYEAGAMAMGRKADTVTMAEGYSAVAAVTTAQGSCDFSAGAFSVVSAQTMIMNAQATKAPWDGDWFCPLPLQAWNEFLLNKLVNSADHVSREDLPFMKATESRFWGGVNWFLYVEEDAEDMFLSTGAGGAGKQDTLMWHRTALGWAPHTELKVTTQWHNEIDALSINMKMKGAPKALKPNGTGIIRARLRSTGTLAVV